MTEYVTKDSGERAQFESGMQRDTEAGKPRFDLMIPLDVPYEEQFFTRVAALLGRGAVKYNDRNWEKANSEAELARMKSSAYRHFMQWLCGETDEDHAAATVFNLLAYETIRYKIDHAEPEPDFEAVANQIFGKVEWVAPERPTIIGTVGGMPVHEVASTVPVAHFDVAADGAVTQNVSGEIPTEDLRM